MPSDLKKKKAQQKKDARKVQPNKGKIEEESNKTEASNSGDAVVNGNAEPSGVPNGHDVKTNGVELHHGTHHEQDAQFIGSDDEDVEVAAKLAKEIESLDLVSDRVAQHRAVTGVLTSHSESRDVSISNLSITFHGKELLVDTKLEFVCGRRYGLIGLNGCGKSTLLAVLANREVKIPNHIDVYLLQREAPPSNKTALDWVKDVDEERIRLETEAEILATKEDDESQERLMDVYDRLDELDADLSEVRASRILLGLGFTHQMQHTQSKHFSGGWRMRIALARALFVKPALLLLDEPTNHLDLNACVWLEQELSEYKRCLVVISHSQDFLNGVCNNIIHFHKQTLKYYGGNYNQYVKTREELEENQMKKFKWEQDQIAHMKDYIARFGHGSKKLARQAQSKEKTLKKMVDGGLTEKVKTDKTLVFCFPDCGKVPPPVIQIQNVSFRYGPDKPWIYKNLDFGIDLDRRVALVGPNGAGKSTILKLICGELEASEGIIRRHPKCRIGRYHQHLHEMLDVNLTPMEFFQKNFPEIKDVDDVRKILGRYGLSGAQQVCAIRTLSDGQRCRVIFAWLAQKCPHILLLDEPTNHLDIETIDSLADALNDFEGGMLLVSHDFRLIEQVAEEVWVCDKERITVWDGDIFSYKEHLVKSISKNDAKLKK